MSELKAFDVGLGQYCEDGSPCVVAFDADRNPRILNEKVYLKSEADKVIAELEEKVDALICSVGVIQKMAEMKSRHHNYKRCLDNSFICFCLKRDADERSLQAYNKGLMDIMQKWNNKTIRYEKWQFKWFELAKKFKKAK